jgi:sec-independent protein translocase protein TatA
LNIDFHSQFKIGMKLDLVLFLNSIGGGEIFIIILVVLLFFGSKKIPELARGLGKGMREFKDATNSIQKEIKDSARSIREDTDINKLL